ncbi:MAG: SpoIID/LytB domain-containing protein [Terracidiphilus sp.]|jgi:stage II sporulation protein D
MKAGLVSRWGAVLAMALVAVGLAGGQGSIAKPAAHSSATLRVGLWTLWHDKEVTVSPAAEGGAVMRECDGCAAVAIVRPVVIRAVGARLEIKGKDEGASVRLTGAFSLAAHDERITLRNPVRIGARNGELVLAATLPVESYVERVVASESGAGDSAESLKALAIVVRSFALHQAHGHADYDLCDSTHCQLLHWGGNAGRQSAAHAATLSTAGETLWFHGQRAEAWFHQNCGGRTASPAEVWPGNGVGRKAMPWLSSRSDRYCTAGGAREWAADLSLTELTSALAAAGLARPGWKSLTVAQRGESGRAVALLADSKEISAEDFRLAVGRALGWNKILSNWFEVSGQGDRFYFHGRGSGHGVGLCQAGAAAMGASGHDVTEILGQYFPGATAADEGTRLSWQRVSGQGFDLETLDPADAVYLPRLSQALAEAESRSGLQPAETITVRAFHSTTAFRDGTLAPGWVAAFTEGNWIGTQPLRTLMGRGLLVSVLRHEFLHALVEGEASGGTPLWLREGLVEAWSDEVKPNGAAPALKIDEIDRALVHAESEAQSQAAHRAAGWYAAKLIERFGRGQVIGWLRTGLPASAVAAHDR